jgi:hypothetical protein
LHTDLAETPVRRPNRTEAVFHPTQFSPEIRARILMRKIVIGKTRTKKESDKNKKNQNKKKRISLIAPWLRQGNKSCPNAITIPL